MNQLIRPHHLPIILYPVDNKHNEYRYQRLTEAERHATATGYEGARYPWESALDGSEQIPPPALLRTGRRRYGNAKFRGDISDPER